jgi:hypothetical protein
MRARIACLVSLLALLPLAHPARAQQWYLGTEAGRIRSVLDPAGATSTLSLGLRYEDLSSTLRFSAGMPTRSDESLWGGIGASRRLAVRAGRFEAGVDLLGNAFGLFDRAPEPLPVPNPGPLNPPQPVPNAERSGHALAGQVLPVLGYDGALVQLRARAGGSRYTARIAGQALDRSVALADVQVMFTPASSIALVPVLQRYQAANENASSFTGMSAVAASSSGSVWAMVGRWSPDSVTDLPWGVGARLQLHPIVSLDASARHSVFDPLYLQPAQTSWSVGLSVLVAGRRRNAAPPVPAAYTGGRALIRLLASDSKSAPSIAGDFNAWTPAPMRREGNHWTYTVAVAPGVYHYAFVSGAGEWFVPKSVAGRKDDGMGGHVAVLVVR